MSTHEYTPKVRIVFEQNILPNMTTLLPPTPPNQQNGDSEPEGTGPRVSGRRPR